MSFDRGVVLLKIVNKPLWQKTESLEQIMPIRKAAQNAGSVRLRPILMTALAFVFGVMPMLFATGAGAASRISLGTAVVFGMAINALIGTFFVPNFWELFQKFQEKYLSKIFSKSDQVSGTSDQSQDKI